MYGEKHQKGGQETRQKGGHQRVIRPIVLLYLLLAVSSHVAVSCLEMAPSASPGWKLPPIDPVQRRRPLLANYHHMALMDGPVPHKEERLAQWDLVILNHDDVVREKLSLERMRDAHPGITILAWIPMQGPNSGLAARVPRPGADDWFARDAAGEYLTPHWGGHLMNPWIHDFAWARHLLQYIQRECLGPGLYDGVMIDCLWEYPPGGMDVNGDGICDSQDMRDWQTAVLWLLRELRQFYPDSLIVGNGGEPWSAECPYRRFANGCMHENALGDQFGSTEWQPLWDGIVRNLEQSGPRPALHIVAVDIRAGGRSEAQARRLQRLDSDDKRRFRLGLGTSLLLDGVYFGFDRGDCLHGQLWWFDEYDMDLGEPLGEYESDVLGAGTFRRRFVHGQVVVNPTDAAVTLSLPEPHRDTTTGRIGQELHLSAHDARILVRP